MKKTIKEVAETLGLNEKTILSLGELEKVAKEADCTLYEVMKYFRFGR